MCTSANFTLIWTMLFRSSNHSIYYNHLKQFIIHYMFMFMDILVSKGCIYSRNLLDFLMWDMAHIWTMLLILNLIIALGLSLLGFLISHASLVLSLVLALTLTLIMEGNKGNDNDNEGKGGGLAWG